MARSRKKKWLHPGCGYNVGRDLDVRQIVIRNNDLPANLLISSEEIKRVLD